MTLDHQDIEMIAARIVDLLREQQPDGEQRFVDAATVARKLGVDRDWVYAHSAELGGVRLGGEHGRLRFDLEAIRRQLATPAPKVRLRVGSATLTMCRSIADMKTPVT